MLFEPEGAVGAWRKMVRFVVRRAPPGIGEGRTEGGAMTGAGEPFFSARGLQKRFGQQVVLEDISLSFGRGTCQRHHGTERRRQVDLLQRADRRL